MVVAGPDIKNPVPCIDRRRGPHRRAGRAIKLCADRVSALRRCLRGRVRGPDDGAARGVKGNDRPSAFAAFICWIAGGAAVVVRDRDIEPVLEQNRRAGDHGPGFVVGRHLPDRFAGRCVNAIGISTVVAKQGDDPAAEVRDRDRGPHHSACAIVPVIAAALLIERIDMAVLPADEDAARRHRRLSEHHHRARHAERPFELEPGKIRGGEARRGLKPPVFEIAAPAVEGRPVE